MEANNSHRCSKKYLLKGGKIGGVLAGIWIIGSLILGAVFFDTSEEMFVAQTLGPVIYVFDLFFRCLVDLGVFNKHNVFAFFALFIIFVILIGFLLGVGLAYLVKKTKDLCQADK